MDTKPTIPDALEEQYELRHHLVGTLYVIEAKLPDSAADCEISYYLCRHNILDLATDEKLINYDHQGQISRTNNPNYILVEGRKDVGLFSVKERRLIISVSYGEVKVLTDTDEFFIVQPRCQNVYGIVNTKGETVLLPEWEEINYQGNCVFEVRKFSGGDDIEASFNAEDGTTIYKTSRRYPGHYDYIW